MMAGSRMALLPATFFLLAIATGCRPTDPQPVQTLSGEKLVSATCIGGSLVTPTQQACQKAILEKCRPGATVVDTGESTRPVYIHPGWATERVWTVLIRNC